MKRNLLIVLIGLLGMTNLIHAQFKAYPVSDLGSVAKMANAENDVVFKYCSDAITDEIGANNPSIKLSAAIELPKTKFGQYAGKTIRAVRIGTPEDTPEVTLFIRNKIDGTNIYTQSVGAISTGWNTIYLNTPFTVPSNDFFMGLTVSGSSYPFGYSGPTTREGSWLWDEESGWVNYESANWGSLCFQVIMNEDVHTKTDVKPVGLIIKNGDALNPVVANVRIQNNSTHAVNGVTIQYKVDDESPVSKTLQQSMTAGGSNVFSFEIPALGEIGTHDLELTVVSIDGEEDENPSDNKITAQFTLYNNYVQRKVLLENFTTAMDEECPAAESRWETVLNSYDDILWVSHHTGAKDDDYAIEESKAYTWFYNEKVDGQEVMYNPGSMLDRTNLKDYGALSGVNALATPGPVFYPQSTMNMKNLANVRLGTPAGVSIEIDRSFEGSERLLSMNVSVKKIEGRTLGSKPVVNVFLVENNIRGTQTGIYGSYTHNHVIRKVLTPIWGDDLVFDGEGNASKNYTFAVPTAWKAENMEIIAFVGNNDFETNVNNCEVYNAESIDLGYVLVAAESVTLNEEVVELHVGETFQFEATVHPENAVNKTVSWKVGNTSIIKLKSGTPGLVQAYSIGETTITATTQDGGHKATCLVKVIEGSNINDVKTSDFIENVYVEGNQLYLSISLQDNINVELYDVSGKKMYSRTVSHDGEGEIIVPAMNLKGVYIVKVTSKYGSSVRKIVI